MTNFKKEIKSNRLTASEKLEILDYIEKFPSAPDTRIAEIFRVKFKKPLNRRSVLNYKNSKEQILNAFAVNSESRKCPKARKYEKINEALNEWISKLEMFGAVYSEKILKEKAFLLGETLGISGFTASNGWLQSFKSNYGITQRKLSGEASNLCMDDYANFYATFQEKLQQYHPECIFNCDETALYYKQAPSKSLMKKARSGMKILKDRITVLLCANMTGNAKMKPVIIGKFKSPRALKHFNYSELCEYFSNSSAWMSIYHFNNWLLGFDREMRLKNRKILLLLDNCPAHKTTFEPQNIELMFLPKNSTSITQPLDSGIIKNFKTKYFHLLISNVLSKMSAEIRAEFIFGKINLKDAFIYTVMAWNNVSCETISNCWRKAGYVASGYDVDIGNDDAEENDIEEAIKALDLPDAVHIEEFISIQSSENEILYAIVDSSNPELLLSNSKITEVEETSDEINEDQRPQENKVELSIVLKHFEELKAFITSDEHLHKNVLFALSELEVYMGKKVIKKQKSKITDFFNAIGNKC